MEPIPGPSGSTTHLRSGAGPSLPVSIETGYLHGYLAPLGSRDSGEVTLIFSAEKGSRSETDLLFLQTTEDGSTIAQFKGLDSSLLGHVREISSNDTTVSVGSCFQYGFLFNNGIIAVKRGEFVGRLSLETLPARSKIELGMLDRNRDLVLDGFRALCVEGSDWRQTLAELEHNLRGRWDRIADMWSKFGDQNEEASLPDFNEDWVPEISGRDR
jgi:hypothetical protein